MRQVLAALSLALLGSAWAAQAGPKVTIGQGTLVGKTMPSRQGNKIYAFQGIPYAAAPVGELRFMVGSIFLFFVYSVSYRTPCRLSLAILRSH
jgi:Carboxylesterase family